jgi:heme-degrading monooxygenase HmoA
MKGAAIVTIVRLIFVKLDPADGPAAERLWKAECAPLMIRQDGCVSEELLKSIEAPGEYISYSMWENQASIDRYRASEAHQQIKRHGGTLATIGPPLVKEYVLV